MRRFIIKKSIIAKDLKEALAKEAKAAIEEAYVDQNYQHEELNSKPALGFNNGQR